MGKAFVNSKRRKIRGSKKFKDAEKEFAEELSGKSEEEAEVILETKPILLVDDSNGVLLGICPDPDLEKTPQDKIIIILDDRVEIAQISKNTLIDAYQNNLEPDTIKGISYLIPLFDHAILLDYKFQNRIEAQGNIKNLNFYFKK